MLKYWRVLLLAITLFGAILAIGFKTYPYGRHGVEVVYVSEISPAKDLIKQGMIISSVNGEEIENVDEWNEKIASLKGPVTLTANKKEYNFVVNESLGIDVMDIERTNLEFGLDIRGGTRIILKPKENATKSTVDQVIATIQTRANLYGLTEMNFYPVGVAGDYYIQIEAAGVGREIIDDLLSRQGKFEAKVLKPVEIVGNKSTIELRADSYSVNIYNNSIEVNNKIIYPNETFELKGMQFQYLNITGNRLILLGTAYTGEDIEIVYNDPQRSGVQPRQNFFSFYFVVQVSKEGAERFADITAGIPKYYDMQSGEEYLDSMIYLYLDDQLVSELRIGGELGGKVYQSPQIQGSRTQRDDAITEKLRLQTILRSGALPTTLETVSVDVISPTLGVGFFSSAGYAAIFAAVAVIIIVFARYRSLKIALPLVAIGASEVIIILGIAATGDTAIWASVLVINFLLITTAWWKKHEIDIYAWIGAVLIPLLGLMSWTIDLPAIGGIIAAIGTGVDHQIIITDETRAGEKAEDRKLYLLRDKIKRAFFIIFGAAATTIAAMLPLMFLGIGLVRGFAITTVIGVLVGILITRPAYARIIEGMSK